MEISRIMGINSRKIWSMFSRIQIHDWSIKGRTGISQSFLLYMPEAGAALRRHYNCTLSHSVSKSHMMIFSYNVGVVRPPASGI